MSDHVGLGIDFGTSHTVAVVRWPGGRTRPLIFDGSPLLPSAVAAEPRIGSVQAPQHGPARKPGSATVDAGLVVGRDAVHSGFSAPASCEPNPKRRIDELDVLLGERVVGVGQLIAAVLCRVVAEFERTVGSPPSDVTMTCPASWGAPRRRVLAGAASAAGLSDARLVAEPVAAATYFAQGLGHDVPLGSAVVVYDFGAGTFDASVVSRTAHGFDVLALDGLDNVGGLDIDELVMDLIGAGCPADGWRRVTHPSTMEEQRAARAVRAEAREAKERLSRTASVTVTVPLVGCDVLVTREELEQRARPLVDQTVRVTEGVIRGAKLPKERLVGVFLVGGASRMPLVATQLHRAFGSAPVVIEQPELVVAEGSVLFGVDAPAPAPTTQPAVLQPVSPVPVRPAPTVRQPAPPSVRAALILLSLLVLNLVVLAVYAVVSFAQQADSPNNKPIYVVMAGGAITLASVVLATAYRLRSGRPGARMLTLALTVFGLLTAFVSLSAEALFVVAAPPAALLMLAAGLISTRAAISWFHGARAHERRS